MQKCTTGFSREYFQLVSNRLRAVYFSCRMSPTHKLSRIFSRCEALLAFIVNLDMTCTTIYSMNIWRRKPLVNLTNNWWFAKFYPPIFKNVLFCSGRSNSKSVLIFHKVQLRCEECIIKWPQCFMKLQS